MDVGTWIPVIVGWCDDMGDEGASVPLPAADAPPATGRASIPEWVKIGAGWWTEGALDDDTFVQSIQPPVQNGAIVVAESE